MTIHDINAIRKWRQIPVDMQQRLLTNVFCSNCGVTTIVDYTMNDDELGIVLRGKCKSCANSVARVIEDVSQ